MKCILYLAVSSALFSLCWSACEVKWVKDEHIEELPTDAVLVAENNKAGEFYVGRANVAGVGFTPGRLTFKERQFFYTMDGKEYSLHADFEVLTNPNKCHLNWRRAYGGTLPRGSIEAGTDKTGGKAYPARFLEQFGYMVGKFYKSTNLMYYGWGGGENSKSSYEILTNEEQAIDATIRPSCANHNTFENRDNFVCVCTAAQPCAKIEGASKTAPGVLTTFTTNFYGKRLVKSSGKLEDKGKQVAIEKGDVSQVILKVNRDKKYQTIFGFGGSFTDATGFNLKTVDQKLQDMIINDYFSRDGLEYNLCRIPIGGSDFSTRGYSLDDMEPPETPDKDLSHFALQPEDLNYKIPYINAAQRVVTKPLNVFGSPWSAPGWLKNGFYKGPEGTFPWVGGGIKGEAGGEFQQLYAQYFVKYLEAYKAHNITHWGITVQNEPLAGVPWNSMGYSPESMRDFVAKALGPVLEKMGWGINKLKVMILDHNVSLVKEWVDKFFADPVASKYASGTAIHWYGHDPKDMLDAPQAQHPDKWILATEACLEGGVHPGAWDDGFHLYAYDIIQDLIHHVTGWVDWNMVLDVQKGGPNWKNNFVDAPILVDAPKQTYYRNPTFYALGHFAKFLPPGSVRVDSQVVNNNNNHLNYVVFRTPDNANVVITYNQEGVDVDLVVEDDKASGKLIAKIEPMSMQTFVYYD